MYLSAQETMGWPESIAFLALVLFVLFIIAATLATITENRKIKIAARQDEALRQLVSRYETLAAGTLDAQQRVAADVAELRSRTASIEQILRTVE
jgi:hypothetical protein